MTASPTQIAIAIFIKEALQKTEEFEWHKGLCFYVHKYVESKGKELMTGCFYIRYMEILHDAIYSWKDYSGNPCYPIWLKSYKGTPHSQWDAVFCRAASAALQANYEAKRKQLAQHIVATLKEKYHV